MLPARRTAPGGEVRGAPRLVGMGVTAGDWTVGDGETGDRPTGDGAPRGGSRVMTVRTLEQDGRVEDHDSVATALEHRSPDTVVWIDLVSPTAAELDEVTARLGPGLELHPLLREDLFDTRRRPKIDRYDDHVFLDLVFVRPRPPEELPESWTRHRACVELTGGEVLTLGVVSAIVFGHRVITIRHDAAEPGLDELARRWSAAERGRRDGPGLVIHTLLDLVVDRLSSVSELLDADVDDLEQMVVDGEVPRSEVQSAAFTLRKATALVRRVALPTREVVGQVLRRDGGGFLGAHVTDGNVPYLHDVNDHVVRVSEMLDSLRDELTSVLELNMSLQDAELNQVMKKLSAWAAVIAVPTAVTGYFGQNVPYPGFSEQSGFWLSTVLLLVGAVGLWWWFRRLDWL